MATPILMRHSRDNDHVTAYKGFSWTTLLFGCLVPLFRGDITWFVIMLVLSGTTLGFVHLIFAFTYNALHKSKLIDRGYFAV
jgi:hypothetical protein